MRRAATPWSRDRVPVHIRCGSGIGSVAAAPDSVDSASAGTGSPPRNVASARSGKISTDSSPAHTCAAAVTGVILPSTTPICVMVTMNGSDVARRSPRASVALGPFARQPGSAGGPRTASSASVPPDIQAVACVCSG